MKKIFNGLGVFGSIILAIVLSFTIFTYVIILNVKFAVSEKGMAKTFMKMDIVESIKLTENGTMWEDFMQLAEKLNLNEEQFEKILNSDKVKEEVGSYIGEALESTFNDKTIYLTEERIENFLNIAIDEYNEVSDTKISESERNNIIKSFDQEIITNINEAFGNINLKETIPNEYAEHIEFADNVLFGNFSLYLLIIIIFIIGLIALLRFSYYKWMPYVMTSIIISGILIFIIGLLLLIIPLQDMEILMPLKKILLTRLFISSAILFIITIILGIGKKYIKKIIKERTTIEKQNEEKKEEKQIKETKRKLDKKTFIIIMLALILLSIILFLVFGRKGSYTITFDTNGGTEITSIKVKNGEIVTLPEVPKKEDYIFAGWKNVFHAGSCSNDNRRKTAAPGRSV